MTFEGTLVDLGGPFFDFGGILGDLWGHFL